MWTLIKGYLNTYLNYVVKILTLDTLKKEYVTLTYKKSGKGYMLIITTEKGVVTKFPIKKLVEENHIFVYPYEDLK